MRENMFWNQLAQYHDSVALIDGRTRRHISYNKLAAMVKRVSDQLLLRHKGLVFVSLKNRVEDVVAYLGVLASGNAAYLYGSEITPTDLALAVSCYEPDFIWHGDTSPLPPFDNARNSKGDTIALDVRRPQNIYSHLALMLPTSGSSGLKKRVRLSKGNLQTSAVQVSKALNIAQCDRAITSIPLSHVYGLSVLHSHLQVGASIVVDERSVMERSFWDLVKDTNVTTFSGVPWTYQMLERIGFDNRSSRNLVKFSTTGAKIGQPTLRWLQERLGESEFYFMYGQTEACGRIAVLPPMWRSKKLGSVGRAVPAGHLLCQSDGTIVYSGPNVMLGYANTSADLFAGDLLGGTIDTGDLGHIDSDGCLFITGRKSNICKIYGVRVNLSDAQDWLMERGWETVLSESGPDRITITYKDSLPKEIAGDASALATYLGIPKSAVQLSRVGDFVRSSLGKVISQPVFGGG